MDYKNKYLKYKNKYYNLVIAKKMKGGDPLLHIPLGVAITGILSYIINWYICNDSKNENKISDIETDIKALSDENSKILETLGLMEKTDLVNILEIIQAMLRDEPVLKEKIISDYEKTGNTEQTVLKLLDNSDALHEAIQKLKEQKELSDHKVAELEQTLQEQREELEQEKTTGIEALSTLEEQHHRERAEQELEHKQSIKSIHEILKKNLDALVKTHQEDLKTLEEEAERVNKEHSTIKEDCANEECTSNLKAQLQAKEKEIKYLELERTNKEREHNESLAVTLGELRRLETELTRQKTMCDASNECLGVVEDNLVKVIQDKENIEEMLTKAQEEGKKKKKDRESELAERESELAERESELAKMKTNLKDLEKAHEEDIKTATEQTTHAVRAELTEQIKILTNELDEINNEKNDLERESNALKEEKKKSEVEIITLHETLKDLEGQHDVSLDEILDSHNLMKEDELSDMSAAEIARLSKPLSKEATEAIDARPQNVDKEGEWWNKLTQGVQNELIEHAHSPEWRLPGAGEEEHNMDPAWDRRFGEAESNIRNLGHTIKEFEDHSKEVEEYADDDDKEESPMPTVKEMIPEEQDKIDNGAFTYEINGNRYMLNVDMLKYHKGNVADHFTDQAKKEELALAMRYDESKIELEHIEEYMKGQKMLLELAKLAVVLLKNPREHQTDVENITQLYSSKLKKVNAPRPTITTIKHFNQAFPYFEKPSRVGGNKAELLTAILDKTLQKAGIQTLTTYISYLKQYIAEGTSKPKSRSPSPSQSEHTEGDEQDPTWLSATEMGRGNRRYGQPHRRALDPDSVVSQEDKEAYKEMKDRRSPSSQSDRVPRQAKDYERQHKIREREREEEDRDRQSKAKDDRVLKKVTAPAKRWGAEAEVEILRRREAREGMKTPYDTDPTIGPVQGQGREKATQIEGLTNKGHTRGELAHPQRRQDMLQRLAYDPAQKMEEEKMEEERAWEKGVQPGRRVADGIRKGNELDEDDQVMMAELSGESYTLKGKVGGGNKKVSNPLNDLIKVLVNNINYTNGIKLFDYNKKILKRINKKLDRKVVDNKYIDKMKLFSNKIFKILSNEKLSNNEKNMKVRKYLTKEYNATIN